MFMKSNYLKKIRFSSSNIIFSNNLINLKQLKFSYVDNISKFCFTDKSSKEHMKRHVNDSYVKKSKVVYY